MKSRPFSGRRPDTAFGGAEAGLHRIHDDPDPRHCYRELGRVGYAIPGAAKPIFSKLVSALRRNRGDAVRILDIGCGYGANAAMLKHDFSLRDLYDHWGQKRLESATVEEIVEYDRKFFSRIERDETIEVIGLDRSINAVAFAENVGLLDRGVIADLESEPLPDQDRSDLDAVDLAISTGVVGHVTEKSFERLLPVIAADRRPWLANFVLRFFPYARIERTLEKWGYVTEKLPREAFVEREFVSADEQAAVLDRLNAAGVDPAGMEDQGHLLAEFYLSRPAEQAERQPLGELLAA